MKQPDREWYSLRSLLGNQWAIFYFLLGGREAGKSYATTKFYLNQFLKHGRPFYWLRLTETSATKLLKNNAEKLIDPDLRKKYNLDLETIGDSVYLVRERDKYGRPKEMTFMARVLALSTFYNDKGSGLFDATFLDDPNMYYNICLDEMNREKNEKKSFDILYAFVNQLENLVRSTKERIRVICIGNTLEEASDILCALEFLPEQFGRFYLVKNKKLLTQFLKEFKEAPKSKRQEIQERYKEIDFGKRTVVEYIEPTEQYTTRRHGTIADILYPTASTFTNKIKTDNRLVNTKRLIKPERIVKFDKEESSWFTIWDNGVVARWNGEKIGAVVAMRPYIDEIFSAEQRDLVIEQFDTRVFTFKNLVAFKFFQKELALLKPRK